MLFCFILSFLFVVALVDQGVFYPMAHFRLAPHVLDAGGKPTLSGEKSDDGRMVAIRLPFPPTMLLSDSFAPELQRADVTRRLKNCSVLLDWSPPPVEYARVADADAVSTLLAPGQVRW